MIYKNINVERILTDSRNLFVAEGSLFVALKGERHDGSRYIADLYKRGVRAFVCHNDFDTTPYPEAKFILVDNTLDELHKIAKQKRQNSKARVVAIVGSNGKTIVKEWLAELIGGDMRTVRSPRSYNSQVGVPLSLMNIESDTELAIIEAGISQRTEMQRLENIIKPDDVIITNIGQAHQENFSSLEQKMHEKLQIAANAKRIFYCKDQKMVSEYIEANFPQAEKIGWSMADAKAFTSLFRLQDIISQENLMHAVNYCLASGIEQQNIKRRIAQIESISMRLEQKDGHNNCTIIDDAYNADIDSLSIALDSLHTLGDKKGLSRTVILSDLQQTGLSDSELYCRVSQLLKEKNVSRLIGIGNHISNSIKGIERSQFFATTDDFLHSISTADFKDEAILLKGSRSFHFEHIASLLEQKHHRTVMEVNLGALAHNIAYFRSFLKPETKLLAMVKAYSYGTGSFEIAKLMQQQGVDYLGVAFADEGVDLRQAGITLPIVVMNPEEHSYDVMLNNTLEPELSTIESIKKYSAMARKLDINLAPIHIKIDTGMKRSGFELPDMDSVAQAVNECGNLKVMSSFSHLVGSDEALHDSFTHQQLDIFEAATDRLKKGLGYSFIRHILNSAGIERFSQYQHEMVRLGIGLYGISAVDNSKLRNVITLKSYISQIRPVKAEETVGYSRKTTLKRDSLIAVVPIGYADGLDRRLSNGTGEVIICSKKAPIAGNVCMDICMVDVTDIPEARVGDIVTLFGDENPVWEMSDKIGTIPYEIMTGIGRRVKRIYYTE
ncbi:MAG: alanine racemase [Bacteroidales bacterium]|nr:alanine racemase [Bacteroidales bacterium]